MELILNRPIQWFVCQLHAYELPLRHLFAHVDRTTTRPRSLTGEIRKSLAGCEKISVVSSTPIENTLCEVINKKDLKERSTLPPPMRRDLSEGDIKSLINSDTKPIREIQKFPCHTQALEKCIKLVTEAWNKVCGREARDGSIRATLKSRSVTPNFSKKSDFKCVIEKKRKKEKVKNTISQRILLYGKSL
ncbi:hypothetical protein AVEN_188028-1 [Araneus ventricosus]|uniref:Uncharacterized protein n=1 Tax=Araneus ventricosus TaxID=182803 RepID=A0A4Y2QDG3_ARAVE|nr:hypothetical protein AVEN_188028-1 [Araneus ventricosus]